MAANNPSASKAKQARPRISASDPKFATVIVGEAMDRFVVHEHLLTHYSGFFRAALTGGFKEAEEKLVKLAEDSASIFEIFVYWLYHERLPKASEGDNEDLVAIWASDERSNLTACIRLHIFCDKYGVSKLGRETLDALVDAISESPTAFLPLPAGVQTAFENLPASSPMCRAIVDLFACFSDPEGMEDYTNITFLQKLCSRLTTDRRDIKQRKSRWVLDRCDYHDHKDQEEKRVCRQEHKQTQKQK